MTWGQPTTTVAVVITDRENAEPVRTLLAQLRRINCEIHILQRVNYASVSRIQTPQVVLADADSRFLHTANSLQGNLQAVWEYVPVIMLASTDEISQLPFYAKLNDFLTLPTTLPELEARIRFALWKTHGTAPSHDQIEINGLRMDTATYEVWANNRAVNLTYKEFELLKFLITHPRRVYSRSELLEMVWENEYYGGTRTVDVHILRLRSKLGTIFGKMIHTVRNVGYRFG